MARRAIRPRRATPACLGGVNNIGEILRDANADEAQLALSLIVWLQEAPDPRIVDEWVRRELHAYSTPKRPETASLNHAV
jgi:hypothetical protein